MSPHLATEAASDGSPGADSNEGPQSPTSPINHNSSHSPSSGHHGHSNSGTASGNGAGSLNPRSCVTCRKRKVKCDKKHPCTNCSKAQIDCIYPAPGRAPRKVKKNNESDLMLRLRRLEGLVKALGPNSDIRALIEDQQNQATNSQDGSTEPERSRSVPQIESRNSVSDDNVMRSTGVDEVTSPNLKRVGTDNADFMHRINAGSWFDWHPVQTKPSEAVENRFGRLVIDEGRSRYINNSFWASLNTEVEDLKGLLNESSDDEEEGATPESIGSARLSDHHASFWGYRSASVNLLDFHPPKPHILRYWHIFKENVDPVVKILHIPTVEKQLFEIIDHLEKIGKAWEPLWFTVYYSAVTSIDDYQCLKEFGESRDVLLERYRFALQQALAKANFLVTEEMVVLQAFTIFMLVLRRNEDARIIWTMTGLVVRMAQTIGLHRDGTHFKLKPFETEMRRRLWWQICNIDSRASEDHGCDPVIVETLFDTKLPLNINDADISPDMEDFPPEKEGFTESTFGLIRSEVTIVLRRINYVPPNPTACNRFYASVSFEDKRRWISELHARLEDKYLKHCDVSDPLRWVTGTICRLIMAKMWLMVYHPFQRRDGGRSLPQEVKDKLFITSLENIEYVLLLENEARTLKWGWLFKTYVQWHALAFLLNELCVRTSGPLVDRAWTAVDQAMKLQQAVRKDDRRGHLWRPLRRLFAKAKEVRAKTLQNEGGGAMGETMQVDTTSLAGMQAAGLQPMFADPRALPSVSSASDPNGTLVLPPKPSSFLEQPSAHNHWWGEANEVLNAEKGMSDGDFDIPPAPAGTAPVNPAVAAAAAAGNLNPMMAPAVTGAAATNGMMNGTAPLANAANAGMATNSLSPASLLNSGPVNAGTGIDLTNSPPFDLQSEDTMDWTNWDDMVRQFGDDTQGQGISQSWAPVFPSSMETWF